jgi:transaldolase
MKFFVDSADINEIRPVVEWGMCDGVTTNPSLVAKTGKSLKQVIEEVTALVDGPISVEVTALDYEGMMKEARALAALHDNLVIKIPMTKDGMRATRTCADEGIPVNVTLVFTPSQALLAAKAGAAYVSPFIGRLDDVSAVGMDLIEDIQTIYANYDFDTEVIVASVRHPLHVVEAAKLGADIATIPFAVLDRLFQHPPTDAGIEKFLKDWEKVPR